MLVWAWFACTALALSVGLAGPPRAPDVPEFLAQADAATEQEERLFADAADGRFDEHSLFFAALIASGTSSAEQSAHQARWARLELELLAVTAVLPPESRARFAFEFVHRNLLTGHYELGCSDLGRTLTQGHYNCVTATILFQVAAGRIGLSPTPVAVPAHVFSRFEGTPPFDIETTCPDWFAIVQDPERRARTRYGQVLNSAGPRPRALTPTELVGKVYYNRGVAAIERRDFAAAIGLLRKSLRLDAHDAPARENLLAAINNGALACSDAAEFEQASALLRFGRDLDGTYAPFAANDLHIHQRWVAALCQAGRFSEALDLLDRGFERRPEAPLFDTGRFVVARDWAAALFDAEREEQARAVLKQTRRRYAGRWEVLHYEASAFHDRVRRLQGQGRLAEARAALEDGLRWQPENELLQRCRQELAVTAEPTDDGPELGWPGPERP